MGALTYDQSEETIYNRHLCLVKSHSARKYTHINSHKCLCAPAALCLLLLHGLSYAMSHNSFRLSQAYSSAVRHLQNRAANEQNDVFLMQHMVWS